MLSKIPYVSKSVSANLAFHQTNLIHIHPSKILHNAVNHKKGGTL